MTIVSAVLTFVLFLQPTMQAPPKFSASLLAGHESVQPGGQTEVLVEIDVEQPWHIYDPIILDTGLPTEVEFTAPTGVTVGELRFPAPALGKDAGFEYLDHSGTIRALAPLTIAADVEPGQTVSIVARISALACKQLCLPVKASAELELPITAEHGSPANEKAFAEARERLAPPLADAPYLRGSQLRVSKQRIGIDEPAELIATIRVQKGHHIQDRDPGVEGLIPARLFVEKAAGLEFVEQKAQVWPKPHVREIQYIGKVREQTGDFEIRVPFRITDQAFPSGPVSIRVLFQYQACNDVGQCFAPEMASGIVRLDADTPNPRVSADIAAVDAAGDDGAVVTSEPDAAGTEATEAHAASAFTAEDLARVIPPFTEAAWADGIPWQEWQPGLPEALSRAGHEVYVDFTADWCLTCQSNKKLVLETREIREKMRALGIVPIEADFTHNNPVMFAEMKSFGRGGVPVNVVYAPGKPDITALLPELLTRGTVIRALENPEEFTSGGEIHLLWVLLAGLLGGLILNVMPCVLPVISIKVLSFVQQAGEDPKRVFRLGLAFCAGIMVWFWIFGAVAAYGNMPLQSPQVVIALGSIMFVFSLNLFGVFEIVLPGAAAGGLDAAARREGYPGAFLKGLLATLLGTACTAPFLGFALGYALTQPRWVGLAIFTSAGAGMGLPYLLLSAKPTWLKYVPKPGPWMVTFKQAMAFVLLATAVWLLWILGRQIGADGVVWTVCFWGFLGLAVWMLGKIRPTWQAAGRATMWTAAMLVALLGFYFCHFVMYDWDAPRTATNAAQSPPATVARPAPATE